MFYLEELKRLGKVCESLGIDPESLAALELMTTDPRYSSERSDLRARIIEAAGEIITDTRERERSDTIAALLAAGFNQDDEDLDTYVRLAEGNTHSVLIEMKTRHSDHWYEFVLEVNEAETLRGKSGEFQKLLEAVGIKQEVKG